MTEISRELGISRQTIYRWINEGELDRDLEEVRYGPRPPVPTKLDPYKAIVRERLYFDLDGSQARDRHVHRLGCGHGLYSLCRSFGLLRVDGGVHSI